MKTQTPQPSPPYERDGKWFFIFHKLTGPQEMGPHGSSAAAHQAFMTALRIHEANGYTDGPITSVME